MLRPGLARVFSVCGGLRPRCRQRCRHPGATQRSCRASGRRAADRDPSPRWPKSADGTVTGWGNGFIALSGYFTSPSLYLSFDYWELDSSGCYEAVDATVTNLGLTGGHLDLILSQDCGGVVCMDHYAGQIAR